MALPVLAEPVRIAVYNVELQRDGPGLLLQNILSGRDRQVALTARVIRDTRPDILLILGFDHDVEGRAISVYRDVLGAGAQGLSYPYIHSPSQNAGVDSGQDLNGDGLLRGPADAFGYGDFRGRGGMAILSRFPLSEPRDFSRVLWRDLPEADLPVRVDGTPYPSPSAQEAMRLSSHGHWDVVATLPNGQRIHLLASYSSPPVFDGDEDMNGKRNRDELLFWEHYLSGHRFADSSGVQRPFEGGDYVLLAGLNADPKDGEGAGELLRDIRRRGQFFDPEPASLGAAEATAEQGGVNRMHLGDPALDTADWRDDPAPGNLRVDYVLPSTGFHVLDSGVVWPAHGTQLFETVTEAQALGSRHRLVWADVE